MSVLAQDEAVGQQEPFQRGCRSGFADEPPARWTDEAIAESNRRQALEDDDMGDAARMNALEPLRRLPRFAGVQVSEGIHGMVFRGSAEIESKARTAMVFVTLVGTEGVSGSGRADNAADALAMAVADAVAKARAKEVA